MEANTLNTSDFILQRVAPIFNKQGYVGTSLSDLTEATGLTKGAIYFNFKNKEELAIKAFKFNVKQVIAPLADQLGAANGAIDKLKVLTTYYRGYYDMIVESGGCPILNVSADANHINPILFDMVKKVSKRLENDLIVMIQTGIDMAELKQETNATTYGKNIYAMVEGSIFLALTHQDRKYIDSMMDMIDELINDKLKV
ncbi:TetR/AcrR family transcriptional regulator [Mucilaginibacter sp. AW1-3]